jgi:hypothetical protein
MTETRERFILFVVALLILAMVLVSSYGLLLVY